MSGMGTGWSGGAFVQRSWRDTAWIQAAFNSAAWIRNNAWIQAAWDDVTNRDPGTIPLDEVLRTATGKNGADAWHDLFSTNAKESLPDAEKRNLIALGATAGGCLPDMWRELFGRTKASCLASYKTRQVIYF